MTRYLAITTCNGEQWQRYGRAMARTFCRHWPSSVPLRVYAEGFEAAPDDPRVEYVSLNAEAPWLATFKALYRDPKYNGGQNGRDYRHDAVRFAHKIAALGAAAGITGADELYSEAEKYNCDVLIWMDADIVTHERVTVDWLDSLFPEPATVAWLDRERAYPECGFVMYRMPAARKVIRNLVMLYRTGALFQLPEWHDSFALQHVVNAMVQRGKATVHSLSGPEGRKHIGHPFIASELASRMDHLKGEVRKNAGRSVMGKETKARRPEPYWQ